MRFRATIGVCLLVIATSPARAAEPTVDDCLWANESSIALRAQQKLHAARSRLLVCAAVTCPAEVRLECTRRLAVVDATMASVVFELSDEVGNQIVDARVTVDGQPLVDHVDGSAVEVDPRSEERRVGKECRL